jgi:hypothetical protein
METFGNKKSPKIPKKYNCEICMYNTCNLKDYKKHINTIKHKNLEMETNGNKKSPKITKNLFFCDCGVGFLSRAGLWKHRKSCGDFSQFLSPNNIAVNNTVKTNNNTNNANYEFNKETLIEIIKQNHDFQMDMQKQMIDFMKTNVCYNNSINTINNLHNSNNKTFNLQFFLNETCKDAMNITDFVESVKLQVSDLENVGKLGYIEGISNIIIKNLQALDVEKRPVHCADQKREVIYVKDENMWEKEDASNQKLRKAIRMIAHKNICMFKEFRDKYPDCEDYDSNKNSQYNKIVYESMGGKGDNDYDKDTKIIKKIAKNVIIDKIMK